LFIAVVYVKVVVWRQPVRMGTALVYGSFAVAGLLYALEDMYVRWKQGRGTDGPGDRTDPTTKKVLLALVVVPGGCLTLAAVLGFKWVPGVRGSAVWITGPNDAVELGAHRALNFARSAPFTFAGWVRTTSGGIVLSLRNSEDGGADIMLSVEHNRLAILV